ncbi:dUTP diphosphatase [Paenibacillus sp. GCM10012307]|uniref:dUTP diphosphatase n=1 Tax=Paenibacillus roseus TaxID=2798579 RepID=A0A934JCB3_9BACL|nr:deoxyuridine 5'-triphosphate nucleotidohydrolase [Paenibacillus roseus]MBJ6364183.1 deoxyuridine 5'-triphosphate nucleotidohydrolase [Paenibacillus roseus]
MNVKIHRLSENARTPTYGSEVAAAFDLYAAADVIVAPGETAKIPLGFAVEIPDGYEMQIRPRSGITLKTKLRVANAPGTIDADYRGEVAVIFDNIAPESEFDDAYPCRLDGWVDSAYKGESCAYHTYNIYVGDRIAQAVILPVPRVSFEEVSAASELSDTTRGDGGFGSSGV